MSIDRGVTNGHLLSIDLWFVVDYVENIMLFS